MNLTINNTAFSGKREVIYGLKNAAREAKQAEFHRASSFSPRPINKQHLVKERKEVLQAYMDVAVFDDSLEQTLKDLPTQKEGQEIKDMVRPTILQWGEINPEQLFEDSLIKNCMAQKKAINVDVLNKFLSFLR